MGSGFLGLRGSGDWVTDGRPEDWRSLMLYLYINGDLPLTALTAKMKSEVTTDPQFNWWTKIQPSQAGAITGVYTDAGLSAAYVSGAVVGSVLYAKCAAATASHFRIGHTALLRDASDFTVDVVGKVIGVSSNGASSYIAVKLLEADDNSTTHDLSDADRIIVIGSINAEGAAMPNGISYDPDKMYNLTQIFRTPLSITRTARKTKLRTGDAYKEMKREALEIHGIEMERAFMFGVRYEGIGDNGKPERATEGLVTCIRNNNSGCVNDYTQNATYAGKKWMDDGGGEDWLDYYLQQVFLYGRQEKLAFCGNGTLLALNKLAKANGHFTMTSTTKAYGMKVVEWITPFGTIYLKTHPLFNLETTLMKSMLIFEPENISYRYIDDTQFYGEGEAKQAAPGTNGGRVDGTQEEFLTEAGLEYHHPYTAAFLNGFGDNNSL